MSDAPATKILGLMPADFVAACIIVIGPAVALFCGYGASGGALLLGSGLSLGLLGRFENVKTLAAWGFRAELREARAIAAEVNDTAEEIRRLALPISRICLGMASGSGRRDSNSRVKEDARVLVGDLLDSIDATGAERQLAFTEWNAWQRVDAALVVFKAISAAASHAHAVNQEMRPLLGGDTLSVAPSSTWRELARMHEALTPEVEEALVGLQASERLGASPPGDAARRTAKRAKSKPSKTA